VMPSRTALVSTAAACALVASRGLIAGLFVMLAGPRSAAVSLVVLWAGCESTREASPPQSMVARDATFDYAADAGRVAAPGGPNLEALSADGPAGAAPSWDGPAGANDVGESDGDSRIVADRASTADAFRFPEQPLPGCVPLCLWRLFAACTRPPEETCETEIHQQTIFARCYSSGAKVVNWLAERRGDVPAPVELG
jgi:hypothetical protein